MSLMDKKVTNICFVKIWQDVVIFLVHMGSVIKLRYSIATFL